MMNGGWVLRIVLWLLFGAVYAFADSMLPVTDVSTIRGDLLVWCGALIGIELVVYAFERVLELLGDWLERRVGMEQQKLFERIHEEEIGADD